MRPLRAAVLTTGLLVWMAGSAAAGEFYYLMIFGSESGQPKRLKFTHTWATFVKATGDGPDPATYSLESFTISWLPATIDVRVLAARPETGVNLDLYQTMDAVRSSGQSVTLWGPYIVLPELYQLGLQHYWRLNSGTVQYRAISGPRNLDISDCIHAVVDVDPVFGRGHYPLTRIGKPASAFISKQFLRHTRLDQYAQDHSWVIRRLGVDRYPIEVVPPAAGSRYHHFRFASVMKLLNVF